MCTDDRFYPGLPWAEMFLVVMNAKGHMELTVVINNEMGLTC